VGAGSGAAEIEQVVPRHELAAAIAALSELTPPLDSDADEARPLRVTAAGRNWLRPRQSRASRPGTVDVNQCDDPMSCLWPVTLLLWCGPIWPSFKDAPDGVKP
jgi:hypothetical protein